MARITGRLPQGGAVLLGPGDDAALVSAPDGRVVVTTDLLIEGRHFRRDWSSGYEIGRKAAAQNLADVVAMGADPTGIVVGLGLPPEAATDWLDDLTDGFRDECDLVGASVVGGDVTRCDLVVVAVTALGDLGGRAPVTRAGARPGDVVAVTGRLGHAAAGLALLHGGRTEPVGLIDAHRRPQPPYARGPQAAALGATSMLDVSDGLLQDLGHVARASGVGIMLAPEAFAVPPLMEEAARLLGADPLEWVLSGGDDHALAATFPEGVRLPPEWTVVGQVVEGDDVQVRGRSPERGGWDHFRK
ncbi:thiamine-phosphate kinase [Streptosporangium sp. NBC_01756]|uniref:thiamine-phosphate kinase n=1 Tax=Streptosporangium sp. NBC_01756 TaxID=2975950 RepID=UPI00308CF03B|nr:thiamine-phosphate kinase [Streptosporangium sp. NBC_01756]